MPDDQLLADVVADDLTDNLMLDLALPSLDSDFPPAIRPDWFLGPETWTISHEIDPSVAGSISKATMKAYVATLQSWFERWVTTGSTPFIHARLYSAGLPACVQVAYATLASYIYRTPANTDTVLQIVEHRSNDLLQDNEGLNVDVFAQVARLHALMIYQIIGLLDGDIRSRYVAESHISTQLKWAGKLLRSAGEVLSDTPTAATQLVGYMPNPSTCLQQQWYLWILSESIRRTWLIAVSICSIYTALQQRSAPCPGGIMYTNRSGLWDATSATEWEKQCLGKNVAFLQRFECAGLFQDAVPADIDEFGTVMLDMTFNGEVLEKWRDRSGALLRSDEQLSIW